jgi:tricorn protease
VDGSGDRRVVTVPLDSENQLRYQDWVAGRRAFTHERGGGRLGYLHVPDMVANGWADFHRDLRLEMAKDGLILDVRDNSGGHTSQLIVEKLVRRVVGWDVSRGFSPVPYPRDAPRGPLVAITDAFAGSDGDIVTQAIKELGIGTVVGERSWGGVIGFDRFHPLVNGVSVTLPRYSFWFQTAGWGVENHGTDPDVVVVMTPQDHVAGRDPQLEKAIEIALAQLEEHPAVRPPQLPPPR